jgi:hypothetical protein
MQGHQKDHQKLVLHWILTLKMHPEVCSLLKVSRKGFHQ